MPEADSLAPKLKGKVDYVIIDKMNYHYADWVYKKYQLKKIQNWNKLANLFKKENIPCQIVF